MTTDLANTVFLLGIPGSAFVDEVASCLRDRCVAHRKLSLDAPLEEKPVGVLPGAVVWEGADLLRAGAVFVERLVFPWPQVGLPPNSLGENAEYKRWVNRRREAMALAWSAVLSVAESRPVVNPPCASDIAVSPSIALDRLSRDGIDVHPWRIEPAPSSFPPGAAIALDASGRDRWHSPMLPPPGEPALLYEPFEGEVLTLLILGSKTVGGIRYEDGESWARGMEPGRGSSVRGTENYGHESAERAALGVLSALGLDFAAVSVRIRGARSSVLLCDAAPDLAAWNRALDGSLSPAFADYLAGRIRSF